MKKFLVSLTLGLIPLSAGILLIAFPSKAVMLAFLVLAVFMILSGVKNLYYSVIMTGLPNSLRNMGIIKNIVSILIGAFVTWRSISRPESLLNFVVYILASYLLLTALFDAVDTRYMRKLGLSNGIGADALVNMVFAVIMFCFPGLIGSTFLTIVGTVLILLGAVLLAGAVISHRNRKEAERSGKEPIDVDWEER